MNSKVLLLIIAILFSNFKVEARKDNCYRSVYADLFNSSNIFSLNFDTRFPNSPIFGWRVGIGYSCSSFSCDGLNYYGPGISLPLGVNALFGGNKNKFEVGIGVTPGIYSYQYRMEVCGYDENGNFYSGYEACGPQSWRAGCAISIDLGYRLQRPKGFFFRTGFSPCLDINSQEIGFHILSLLPYLSFGYSFR